MTTGIGGRLLKRYQNTLYDKIWKEDVFTTHKKYGKIRWGFGSCQEAQGRLTVVGIYGRFI